ncbi:MAG TPA: ATP synthase F0 subunit B [Candidatus Angelobacter sp.]|nr:ATP synthase F0 subunit B [Candidatus Angelobacter sp.]
MALYPGIRGRIPRTLLGVALAILVVPGTFQFSRLQAQEKQPAHASANPAQNEPAPEAGGKQESGRKEAEKAAQETSETDALRNSPMVVWIARHTGLTNNAAYWLCVLLNFAIVFFSVIFVVRKKLPGILRNRTTLIQQRLEEARKTGEEARRRLSEVEGRLARLDVEITEMRREADENAHAEEKRVVAGVAEERRRIVESAEQEIALAANAARRDLKAYAAELAVDLAEKKIEVTKDTDQSLVREFTAHLGKDGN